MTVLLNYAIFIFRNNGVTGQVIMLKMNVSVHYSENHICIWGFKEGKERLWRNG